MKRKRIILVAPPFSGHLHPIIGLALHLQPLAEVLVLSTPRGMRTAQTAGVHALSILEYAEEEVWAIAEPGKEVKGNPLSLYRQLRANIALMAGLRQELDRLYRVHQPDLVIADFTVPVAGWAAQQYGAHWWTTTCSPCVIETRDGPPAYFGGQTPAESWPQKLSQTGMRFATHIFKRTMYGIFQRELRSLGLSGVYRKDGAEAAYSSECILGLWMHELDFPCTYPAAFQMIGPVLYTPPFRHPPPAFTDDGRQRILITLGTHLRHAKAMVCEAVKVMAQRMPNVVFHFSHGQAQQAFVHIEDNFHQYAYISYAKHLTQYDLIVHHGGSGILLHTLQHGKPAIVYPLDFDQFDNAARLISTGAALRARTITDLEPLIQHALEDTSLCNASKRLAKAMSAYQPQNKLTRLLETIL